MAANNLTERSSSSLLSSSWSASSDCVSNFQCALSYRFCLSQIPRVHSSCGMWKSGGTTNRTHRNLHSTQQIINGGIISLLCGGIAIDRTVCNFIRSRSISDHINRKLLVCLFGCASTLTALDDLFSPWMRTAFHVSRLGDKEEEKGRRRKADTPHTAHRTHELKSF